MIGRNLWSPIPFLLCLTMSNRSELLRAGITHQMQGIEYGPSYSPLLPKSEGWNVTIVDHASQEDLIAKYSNWGVPVELIEPVDIVITDDNPIEKQLAAEAGKIDYIIASHVFEHLPNPLGFLEVCDYLLSPKGFLRLAIPDKRFCFDLLKPLTTAGDLIQAFVEKRVRPTLGQYYNAMAMHSLKAGQPAFPGETGMDNISLQNHPKDVYHNALQAHQSLSYVDIHAWTFTPSSFAAAMRLLDSSGLSKLSLEQIEADGIYEFFVTFSKYSDRRNSETDTRDNSDLILQSLILSFKEEQQARFPLGSPSAV
jgi:hypothetical protein